MHANSTDIALVWDIAILAMVLIDIGVMNPEYVGLVSMPTPVLAFHTGKPQSSSVPPPNFDLRKYKLRC